MTLHKSWLCNKDSIAKIETGLRKKYDGIRYYYKQLVNLVNDNKKSKYVDFNHQRFLLALLPFIN
jgi:hypothetical protein